MLSSLTCRWILVFLALPGVLTFNLTIIHTNDAHAKFEQTNEATSDCKPETAAKNGCFGGVARRMTKIKELRQTKTNTILLDAGDQFQGTFWYNYYKGEAASHFMNMMDYDVMALGNHEFDDGIDVLVKFIDNVTFPVLSANVDITKEPKLTGKLSKRTTVHVGNEKIGIVGYTTEDVPLLANPGDTVSFTNIRIAVQAEIDALETEGVNKIVVLGHAGYIIDKILAAELNGVDIVVGGHSHTFLYTGDPPSTEKPEGEYPTIITNNHDNKPVPVVTAYAYGKYVGMIELEFDSLGKLVSWSGGPILLNGSVIQDPVALDDVKNMSVGINEFKTRIVGSSLVDLEGDTNYCRAQECNMGNLIADALVWYFQPKTYSTKPATGWTTAAISLVNSGGIRAPIEKGEITLFDISSTQPFGNTIDMIYLKGKDLLTVLEVSVTGPIGKNGGFLQYSGIHVKYNMDKPFGSRVVWAEVRCADCDVPKYGPIESETSYAIITNTFLLAGKDGYTVLKEKGFDRKLIGEVDVTISQEYIENHSPLSTEVEGRITFQTEDSVCGGNMLIPHSISQTFILILVSFILKSFL